MHLKDGEIRHDGTIEDHKLYLKALEWGIFPGEPAYPYRKLTSAFPEGYFDSQLEGTEAVLRGLVRLAFSQSIDKPRAIAHLAEFSQQAIGQSEVSS